jgi:hypothetical protein
VEAAIDRATAGLEQDSAEWHAAACLELPGPLLAMHRTLLGLGRQGWQQLRPLLAWTSHPALLAGAWQLAARGGPHAGLELLLLLTPLLERSLGDLLVQVAGLASVPALLRDLLARPELQEALGRPCLLLLRLLLGHPASLNLRNLVWHGFAAPSELSIVFGSALLLILPNIGHRLQDRQAVAKRPLGSLARIQAVLETNASGLPPAPPPAGLQLLAAESALLPAPQLPLLQLALEHLAAGRPLPACLLLLPLLESALRHRYVRANGCPARLVTAEATQLYTTFTEMLGEESPLRAELGPGPLLLLQDLLTLPGGPRARDRLGHGELGVGEEAERAHLAPLAALLLTALATVLATSPSATLGPYQSAFHPAMVLARGLLLHPALLARLGVAERAARVELELPGLDGLELELVALGPDLVTLEELHRRMTARLAPYLGDCLYRPRAEYEVISLLDRSSRQLGRALQAALDNLAERRRQVAARSLRSRARATYRSMLGALPTLRRGLFTTLGLLFHTLMDKDALGRLPASELGTKVKTLKQVLQAVENIAKDVDGQRNQWEDCTRRCLALQGLSPS